jgi:hypothetical protein
MCSLFTTGIGAQLRKVVVKTNDKLEIGTSMTSRSCLAREERSICQCESVAESWWKAVPSKPSWARRNILTKRLVDLH